MLILGIKWYVWLVLWGIFFLTLYVCQKMNEEQDKIEAYEKILEQEDT